MADALKNIYNDSFFKEFTAAIKVVVPGLDNSNFVSACKTDAWDGMELKQRMRHLATTLHHVLDQKYQKSLRQLLRVVRALPLARSNEFGSLAYMLFPDFVEQYGLSEPDISLTAMEELTTFASCEFAIRPYLISYPEKVMTKMLGWSTHSDHRVRRFASEGCRPRLPWAIAIPFLKKDPSQILPILENLKTDASEFVRRSVANNLNDIAKDHPKTVLDTCRKWQGQSSETDWIIKHGCRTLLKSGNAEALHLFGTGDAAKVKITNFSLSTERVSIGNALHFSFHLTLTEKAPAKLRLEYAIFYTKANQKQTRKIFKISELTAQPRSTLAFTRKLSLKDLTTRRHYPGMHAIAIVVNGEERARKNFEVTVK